MDLPPCSEPAGSNQTGAEEAERFDKPVSRHQQPCQQDQLEEATGHHHSRPGGGALSGLPHLVGPGIEYTGQDQPEGATGHHHTRSGGGALSGLPHLVGPGIERMQPPPPPS
jgi:hypothetical protein